MTGPGLLFRLVLPLCGLLTAAGMAYAAGDPDGLDADETSLEMPQEEQAAPAQETPATTETEIAPPPAAASDTEPTAEDAPAAEDDFAQEPSFYYYPRVKLRALNKVTAQTRTLELAIGESSAFGPIFIRPQVCQKPPAIEKPEASTFIQVWETGDDDESRWVFSGWMFASSPALSAMDHPVYDVWVIDCVGDALNAAPAPKADDTASAPEESPAETPPAEPAQPAVTDTDARPED